ncbi:hypothetical protein [Paraburkholderia tropica]|uniref:hypothetical protein n=1 Tax=Paraburkholderia tropica TaxID=92647 RepID=UPI002AB77C0F|nr:hypothetical protein [Paraburkholderia tropica]
MIDIDKLEELAKAATTGLPGDRIQFSLAVWDPAAILKLIAEMRRLRTEINDFTTQCGELNEEVVRLRAELATPLLTGADAPLYGGIFCAEGISHEAAESAFYTGAPAVTVYYGRRHLYTCLAEFYAENPKEKS